MAEDKPTIVRYLMTTLQATSYYHDLMDLVYEKDETSETVIAKFANGTEKRINVNLDSGVAMIDDVLKGLEENE